VLIPIQCEYYALEGIGQLIRTIEKVRRNLNPDLEVEGILLTMYDSRTNLSQQIVDEIRRFFGEKVYKVIVPRNVRLSEAPSFGKSIIEYDIISSGAEAYLKLAEEVIGAGRET
jgi:chromosome partitioning protein